MTRIRLMVSLAAGTLYIDDITITYNGAATPVYVAGHENLETTATECVVTGLQPSTDYFYTVTALSGDMLSLPSAEVAVTTADADGVQAAKGDDGAGARVVITNDGLRIVTGKRIYTIDGYLWE